MCVVGSAVAACHSPLGKHMCMDMHMVICIDMCTDTCMEMFRDILLTIGMCHKPTRYACM